MAKRAAANTEATPDASGVADATVTPAWPADSVERWPISRIKPNPKNARTHDDAQVAQLVASMRKWGWTMALLVDEEGGLIAGHGRLKAAIEAGYTDAPVMVARGWTKDQCDAYALADNKLALNAGWDDLLLADGLASLKAVGFDLDLIGFSTGEQKRLLGTGEIPVAGTYREQYAVLVVCEDAAEQERFYDRLVGMGYNCKVVVT